MTEQLTHNAALYLNAKKILHRWSKLGATLPNAYICAVCDWAFFDSDECATSTSTFVYCPGCGRKIDRKGPTK